jgi:hypothetical protein
MVCHGTENRITEGNKRQQEMNVEQLETYCQAQVRATENASRANAYRKVDAFLHREHPSKERMLTELAQTATRVQQTIEMIQQTGYAVTMLDTYQAQEEVCEELFELLLTSPR